MAPEDVAGPPDGSSEQDRPPDSDAQSIPDGIVEQREDLARLREKVDAAFGFVDAGRDAEGERADDHLEEALRLEAEESGNGSNGGADRSGQIVKARRIRKILDDGDPASFSAIIQRAGANCWREIIGLIDCVYDRVGETMGYDEEVGAMVCVEEDEALQWWMEQFQGLTIRQITASYLMGYGREDKEISEHLGIPLHDLKYWREREPEFKRLLAFWEKDHNQGIDGLLKRIIAAFAEHQGPEYQAQAAKMIMDREKNLISHRRTDQGDAKQDLDERRFVYDQEHDRRLLGESPQGPSDSFKVLVKQGDVHIHATTPDTPPPMLQAISEVEEALPQLEAPATDEDDDG